MPKDGGVLCIEVWRLKAKVTPMLRIPNRAVDVTAL
jgi:hypothetical protein